jgi:hypothetical protein
LSTGAGRALTLPYSSVGSLPQAPLSRSKTLEVGKLGDLVILSENPLEEAPSEIAKIPVAVTIVGADVAYQDDALG